MCIYVYTHTYSKQLYLDRYLHDVCIYTDTCMYMRVHIYIYIHVSVYDDMCTPIYIYYTHTHGDTHRHTRTPQKQTLNLSLRRCDIVAPFHAWAGIPRSPSDIDQAVPRGIRERLRYQSAGLPLRSSNKVAMTSLSYYN